MNKQGSINQTWLSMFITHNNRNIIYNLLFLLSLILIFPACRKENPPIRIGSTLWPGYDFLYLAKEKGFFEEEGVNVQLFDFVSLSDSRRAFERGQIDVLTGTIVEMLIISNNIKERNIV